MANIVVSGALANKVANGGAAWTRLSWILGFRQLGHQVWFLEQISSPQGTDATGRPVLFESSSNAAWFRQVMEPFDLAHAASLIYEDGQQTIGNSLAEIRAIARSADLLINISGHLSCRPIFPEFRRKVFIDLDPGYTQFWHAADNPAVRLEGHDYFFTVGENLGISECSIPMTGIRWRSTRQPVVLEHWPMTASELNGFTTVASWRGSYGPAQYAGKTFGQKAHEFRKFLELPQRVRQKFELALEIHPADEKDMHSLRRNGWNVVDSREVAAVPCDFRRYVQSSGAEFSVAQGVYVATNSGWFSDRTVRYLASGKPALVQDTGFSRNYPVGEGLLTFRTLDEAISGVEAVARDYPRHSAAARRIAERYFDSNKVLGRLLEEVGIRP